ncbi:Solute carrier family 25 member 33, variant 2 [Balamuthia mandrillaris]
MMQNESDELCRLQAPLPFLSVEEFTTEPPPIVEMLREKEPLFNISSLPTFPSLRTSPISFVLSLACFLFLLFFLVHIFITLRQWLSTLYFRWTTRDRLQSCWFCGHQQKVAWEQLSWWFCQQCEQYNGFNEATGDYNYPIIGMFDPAANRTPISRTPQPVPSIISNSETNMLNATCSPSDILCRTCALNQSCWLAQMSSFQPSSENKLEAEAAAFEASLKDSFRLCSLCSRRVEQELQRKHSLLNQYWFGSKLQQSKSALGDIKKQTTSMRRKTKLASALLFYKNVVMAILVAFFLDTFLANHTNLYISNSLGYGFNYFKHRFLPFLSSSVWESLISYMALSLLPVTLLLCIFLLDERRPQLRAVTPPCLLPSSRLLLFVVIAEFVMFGLATVALTDLQSKTIDLSVVAQHGNLLASLLVCLSFFFPLWAEINTKQTSGFGCIERQYQRSKR